MKKSIFRSKTFWGAVLTFVAATSPTIAKEYKHFAQNQNLDPIGISKILVICSTTGLTILGRLDAKQIVYTPRGLPGPDQGDEEVSMK